MISPCWRKALSAFLCVAMILSAFPVLATADDSVSQEPIVEESTLPAAEDSADLESLTEEPEDPVITSEDALIQEEDGDAADELPAEEIPAEDSPAVTEEVPAEDVLTEGISPVFSFVNPYCEDVAAEEEYVSLDGAAEYEVDGSCSTPEEAASVLREQMKARRTAFVFEYTTSDYPSDDYVSEFFDEVLELALSHTGDPVEGDYLLWHYRWYSYYYNWAYRNGRYTMFIHCTFSYYTDADQEAALSRKVNSVLRELDVSGLNSFGKIAAVYDYICSNVKYDYKSSSSLKYTAYAALVNGKSVCQGYTLLLYRLALELGVDCRIIPGTAGGEEHRWNIVLLNGSYYNLDSTYDAGENEYYCFLVSDDNLKNHTRAAKYNSSSFRAAYPMAEEDFDLDAASSTDINWDNIRWSNTDGELTVSGTGEIPDCESSTQTPWAEESYTSVVITGGLTAVGTNNFGGDNIGKITVDQNIQSIGEKAFAGCTDLGSIYIMNDACDIFDAADTLGDPETTVIYGYYTSTARDYANKYGYEFINMGFSNRTVELDVTTAASAKEPVVRIYNASATDLEIYEDVVRDESELEKHAVASVSEETLRDDGLYAREVLLQDVEPGRYKLAVSIPDDYVIRVEYINVSGDMMLGDRHMWMYGDVDDNGVVDSRDATQIYRRSSGLTSIFGSTGTSADEDLRLKAADVNEDGLYTKEDSQKILNFINNVFYVIE